MIADLSLGAARLISAQVPQQQSGWAAPPASTLTSSGEDISLSAIRLPTFRTLSSLALLFSAKAEPSLSASLASYRREDSGSKEAIPRHRSCPFLYTRSAIGNWLPKVSGVTLPCSDACKTVSVGIKSIPRLSTATAPSFWQPKLALEAQS